MCEDSEIDNILREIENKINADLPDEQGRSSALVAAYATCLVGHLLPDDLRGVFRDITGPEYMSPEKQTAFFQYLQSERGQAVLHRLRDAIDVFLAS